MLLTWCEHGYALTLVYCTGVDLSLTKRACSRREHGCTLSLLVCTGVDLTLTKRDYRCCKSCMTRCITLCFSNHP
ncbi:hypothetical protein HanXRQr2_Chr04g0182851 [Helianthus annuus]|uniref:Uncharacterized protein n=1 Tax=Helianthus annuus TaxID=4232 RepID=A0A9K3NT40_HELAN|nr:hypothetical protein HanXRQr2_Chr04g0182851 [Helianthus annuus]KAJ0932675.1 hypothetical protein HanPSC8_Chr04g0176351 [Helianthus annuus]